MTLTTPCIAIISKVYSSLLKAFTLAEVLIVLGIIGLIADMTIPTLFNKIDKQVNITMLKKSYSTISQAYTIIKLDYGDSLKGVCAENDSTCFAKLFVPHLRSIREDSGVPSSTKLPNCWNSKEIMNVAEEHSCIVSSDGSFYDFDMEWTDCTNLDGTCAFISVDVNGSKKPNIWGKDRYLFAIKENKVIPFFNKSYSCNDGNGPWGSNMTCADKYLYR